MALLERITTVTEEASSYDLVTLDEVKSELGITDGKLDQQLGDWITRASSAAANYCNRVFVAETITEDFWPSRDPGPTVMRGGLDPLQLARYPVIELTSVTERDTALVENTDFRVNASAGQLVRFSARTSYPRVWPAERITVVYSAGYADIPGDVQDAVIRMVKARYYARTRDPAIRQENIQDVYSATYWFGSGPGAGSSGLPPDIEGLLQTYRVPVAK